MLLFTNQIMAKEIKIEAYKTSFYVGSSVMACGTLAQVKHTPKVHYLNIDKPYPNQSVTFLVWENNYRWFKQRFGSIDNMIGKRFCARGKIEEYNNGLQIKVNNPQFLRLMNN